LTLFGNRLEKYGAAEILPRLMGKKSFMKMIGKPYLSINFGSFGRNISLAWFLGKNSKKNSIHLRILRRIFGICLKHYPPKKLKKEEEH